MLRALLVLSLGIHALALRLPGRAGRADTATFARRSSGSGGGAIPQSQGDNMQAWGKH